MIAFPYLLIGFILHWILSNTIYAPRIAVSVGKGVVFAYSVHDAIVALPFTALTTLDAWVINITAFRAEYFTSFYVCHASPSPLIVSSTAILPAFKMRSVAVNTSRIALSGGRS